MDLVIFITLAAGCGFLIGFLIFFTGVGGGVLVIPAITLLFQQSPSVAIGTAGLYVTITKIMAGIEHARQRNVDYPLLVRVIAGALPGALLTAVGVNFLLAEYPDYREKLQDALIITIIFAILLSLVALGMKQEESRAANPVGLAVGAFIVGAVMGLTGIGGGVLIVPLLLHCTNVPPKNIVGVSIVAALALSFVTAFVYAGGGQVNYPLAVWMSIGSLVSIPLGGRLIKRASESAVKITMITLIVIAAVLMFVQLLI